MFDLKKIQSAFKSEKNIPKHVLISLSATEVTPEISQKIYAILPEIIDIQLALGIPIATINLPEIDYKEMTAFCERILIKAIENKINVSCFGRWYDIPGFAVEAIKKLTNETSNFDSFFLNFCIRYNGKQEIADACRVIMRKIMADKLDIDSVNPDIIKDNIYSSHLLPPEIIIETGSKFTGAFLWDSAGAKIIFLNKPILEINKADIQKAIE